VRTPSLVAKAVLEHTDHHLIVGKDAQAFARSMGFKIEDDSNTELSRQQWLEWKRRTDPGHYLDPAKRDGDPDRPWRKNVERAAKLKPEWREGKLDASATGELLAERVRTGTGEKLAQISDKDPITLQVIIDRVPGRSSRDIKSDGFLDPKAYLGPWRTKRVTVEGKQLSLDDIEHEIMRPTFKDPRVHFAINSSAFARRPRSQSGSASRTRCNLAPSRSCAASTTRSAWPSRR